MHALTANLLIYFPLPLLGEGQGEGQREKEEAMTEDWRLSTWRGRGLSRRRALQATGLAGAGLATAAAIGCSAGRKPGNAANQPATQATRGGTLTRAGGNAGSYDTQGRTFDPEIQTQFGAKSYGLFYDGLVGYNLSTYAIEPELAQKWEQPSQTEYLFHLQPNVKWQNKPPVNGRPLTADDVVWTLQRARTDDPKFYSRSLLATVDKIEAPDKATVRISTKQPDVSTLQRLSVDNLFILAREVLDKYPKPTTAESAVGTGAFMMTSVEEGVGAEYTRNPDYWRSGRPYLDGMRTKHFADSLSSWAAFLAGQIDIGAVPGTESKKYIAQQGTGFTPYWFADDTLVSFLCPNTKIKPMDDVRVTRALRLLIDHDEFITAWAETHSGRGAYGSIFPQALSGWDLTQDEYKTHPEWKQPKDEAAKEALSLLNAAGFAKSNPLKLTIDSQVHGTVGDGAQLVQAQWKRLGQGVVDAQLKLSDTPTLDGIRASRSFTYGVFGFSAGMVEPGI